MMPVYWVDLAIILIIGLSVITGLIRGFVKELIALCIWVLAIWLAYHYSDLLDPWLQTYIQDNTARKAACFIIILMSTILLGAIINAFFGFILKRSGLSGTDRILGVGFGFVRGIFIVSLIILVIQLTSIPHEEYSRQSKLYAKFDPLVQWIHGLLPEMIKQVQVIDKQKNTADIAVDMDLA